MRCSQNEQNEKYCRWIELEWILNPLHCLFSEYKISTLVPIINWIETHQAIGIAIAYCIFHTFIDSNDWHACSESHSNCNWPFFKELLINWMNFFYIYCSAINCIFDISTHQLICIDELWCKAWIRFINSFIHVNDLIGFNNLDI